MLLYVIMRSAKKKNEIYEIHIRKPPVKLNKSVILLPSVKTRMQKIVPTPALPTSVSTDVPIIVDSIINNDNDVNLQYVKSKIMSDYNSLYKTL